jgi:hypothetical protein
MALHLARFRRGDGALSDGDGVEGVEGGGGDGVVEGGGGGDGNNTAAKVRARSGSPLADDPAKRPRL